jgi:hypothetical protein
MNTHRKIVDKDAFLGKAFLGSNPFYKHHDKSPTVDEFVGKSSGKLVYDSAPTLGTTKQRLLKMTL